MAKLKPLVSVLVGTRNAEKYLKRCLQSLKSQSYPKIEIIVIDRNSSDKTLIIAKKYADRVFEGVEPERSTQINFGAKKAKGKYLYRIDSDFWVDKNHIKNMVEKCEEEELDGIYTYNRPGPPKNFWAKVKHLERTTYLGDSLAVASRFFTKKMFEKVGGFDEALVAMEDYDLQNRLEKAGCRFGHVRTRDNHQAEPDSLWKIALENFYYGGTRGQYLLKHPQKAFKQALPIRPSFLKHWREFIKKPHLTLGLAVMILVMYFSSGLGFLVYLLKKKFHFKLIVLVGLGFLTRLAFLNQIPIYFDESISLLLAKTNLGSLYRATLSDVHPPLYFMILKIWGKVSHNLSWARLLSLVLGSANIYLAGVTAKKAFNQKIGLFTAILFSFSPSLVLDSVNARMYSLAQLFCLLTIYFFLAYLKKRKKLTEIGLTLSLILGFLTHFYFLLLLIPLNLAFICLRKKYQLKLDAWLKIQAVSLIPFLVLILPFLKLTSILPINSPLKIPAVLVTYAISWQGWLMSYLYPFGKSFIASLPAYLLSTYLFFLALCSFKRKNQFPLPVMLFWSIILLPPLAVIVFSYLVRPIFGLGSLAVFTPAYYLLAASGIASFKNKKNQKALILTFVIMSGLFLTSQFLSFGRLKNKLYQPIDYLEKNYAAGDMIIHTDMTTYLPFRYYLKSSNQALVLPFYFAEEMNQALSVNQGKIENLAKDYSRIWYLDLSNSAKQNLIKEKRTYLKSLFQQEDMVPFSWYGYGQVNLNIYLYQIK